MEVLVLSDKDVEVLLNIRKTVELVETAFREKGLKRTQMPPKVYLFFDKYQGDLRAMPAYIEFLDIAGVKLVNVHPQNPALYGLPTVMATVLLFDPKSGKPLCIMNGTWITGARTGAAAAVATKYLAKSNSETVGIIGAGFLAKFHLEAFSKVMDMKKVFIYDIVKAKAEKLAREYEQRLDAKVYVVDSPKEAVEFVDVLATLTPARGPIVRNEWVHEGIHINAMGADAPGKQELDPEILKRAKIVVDDIEQASHSGEINLPLSQGIITLNYIYAELGEVVAGVKRGRESDKEITVFDSTGLAIQDVIVAHYVYIEAINRGFGVKIQI
ncbi:MAG: alanine dehydrogenase [Ignisphaera sp.]|uniref:Alanine dehydrogenase n=1 Tax=Ignisphaera aggregans TaxID=334771 RepID=A0A832CS79_9CREN